MQAKSTTSERPMLSFMEQLQQARELAQPPADPLAKTVAAAVRGFDHISTVALLNSIGMRPTTANARRIAPTMRSLGFIPIKSRRFEPGGYFGTVARGWARPLRGCKRPIPEKETCHAA
jgi:hypothetical protein